MTSHKFRFRFHTTNVPHFWRWDLDGYSCLFVWICLYHLGILTSMPINSTLTRYSLLLWPLVFFDLLKPLLLFLS